MQGAAGEDVAVAGPVDQLDALAVGGELDQVLADDVAGPQARVVRRGAGFFRRRTQRQRGAGGRIELAGVVHLDRSEEHTSELQSPMRISYAVFCLKNKTQNQTNNTHLTTKN